ncbi:MAG: hypothetical protein WCK51_10545 [Armatimonadota bacterium]
MSENSAYDIDAPEGAKSPGAQYMTRKDVKWILLATAGVLLGMVPVYISMRDKAYATTCKKNLSKIGEALQLYADQHDDRFPPVYEVGQNGEPAIGPAGYPYTWVSDIQPLMSIRATFVCPSADPSEYAYSASPTGGDPIPSTYGMYAAYSSSPTKEVENADNIVLVAETANAGASETFNPKPFSGKQDGFLIGWNNSNEAPDESTIAMTRLAFKKTAKENFTQADGRHGFLVHAISVNRGLLLLKSEDAQTEYDRTKYSLAGKWREPLLNKGR